MDISIFEYDTGQSFDKYLDLCSYISDERISQINSCTNNKRKLELLFSELLLRYKLKEHGMNDPVIVKEINGKPFIKDESDIHFNFSHSHGLIILAESTREIGIDVEMIREVKYNIADQFFTENEKEYITSSEDTDHALFEIWTRKEAFLKLTGQGLRCPLETVDTLADNSNAYINTFRYRSYVYSIAFLEEDPDIRLTVYDDPSVFIDFLKKQ